MLHTVGGLKQSSGGPSLVHDRHSREEQTGKKESIFVYNIQLDLRVEIFMEGDVYVALSPELNVSSYGQSVEDARHSLIEAV